MRGTVSRFLYIDSSVNTDGRDHTKVLLPTQAFSCVGNERCSLTLVSFTMRRNWFNINDTNNRFYLFLQNTYHECVIAAGAYTTFVDLGNAIRTAISDTIANNLIAELSANVAVNYNAFQRKFTIILTMTAGNQQVPVEIRCFAVKQGLLPNGVSFLGGFSDVHEILGMKPIRDLNNLYNSSLPPLTLTVGNVTTNSFSSRFPASLNTLDAIYLHLNTELGNFMSSGLESRMPDSLRVSESSIFARIPFDDSTFTEIHEVVSFEDNGGDMYFSFLGGRKSLDSLEIRVTDSKGRSLSTLDPAQAEDGLMAFKMCLRFDIFSPTQNPVATPLITTSDRLP